MDDQKKAQKAYALVVASQAKIEAILANPNAPSAQATIREAIFNCLDAAEILGGLIKRSRPISPSLSHT